MAEDPVTGSLNAALAQWLIGAGHAPPATSPAQGTALGRAGRVHVERMAGEIWIGGESVTCIDGDGDALTDAATRRPPRSSARRALDEGVAWCEATLGVTPAPAASIR